MDLGYTTYVFSKEKPRNADIIIMKKITLPSPVIITISGLGAFWIAGFINPGFNPIGIMILLFLPVLLMDFLWPQQELKLAAENLVVGSETVQPVLDEVPEDQNNSSEA